jgi:exopolyphosphatase/guanosine-5'-triphosphate,3'-diphosphate pyrophosphatase
MSRLSFLFLALTLCLVMFLIWIPLEKNMQANTEIRAAMDIGSGATNLKVANVDLETNKIISKIYEQSIQVPYQKHLEQSTNNTFDQEVMDQGIMAIKELKVAADRFHVKKVIAVATAAFRQAANAQQFADEIEKQTGVEVRIINQDEEGILAFRGALAVSPYDANHAVIWDIGGGSMQLTTLTAEGTYFVEKGKTASIPFKNTIIKEVENKDIHSVQTPNPISEEEMQIALQHAARTAEESSAFIKEKLVAPQTTVIAVGNLFNYGIKKLVNNQDVIRSDDLAKAINGLVGKTDAELNLGALSEVAVSNPILVLGFMYGLHIDQVDVVNINNADGALTNPPYWVE